MKKIGALLAGLLTLLSTGSLVAQQKSKQDNKSLLWRITGKKMQHPSYLFGTMHLICEADYLWTNKMKESLDKSEKVCFEMDLDDQSVMMKVAMGMLDNTGKKLKDYFTAEQYELVSRFVKDSLGMDIALFEQMKPIMLETMISTNGGFNCDNPKSYEDSIMKTALAANKEIFGLEEPQEQIEALESIPADTVIKELLEGITNRSATADTEYAQLIQAYKQQDLPALYNMLTNAKSGGEDMGVFLDVRNKKWIPRMEGKMGKASVFFAVGAGHLWGDVGVIHLLRNQGYTVEPVK